MKTIFFALLLTSSIALNAQTIQQIDSVTFEFCDFIKESKLSDEKKMQVLQEELVLPYFRTLKNADIDKVFNQLFFRLQRNCVEFQLLLEALNPELEAPERLAERPVSKITPQQLEEFKKIKKFYYTEPDGAKTKVTVDNGFWQDKFKDRTFSKLYMKWIGEHEFQLEYIESNNTTRKFLSMPGDKYNYIIISKEDKYYWVCDYIPGQENYTMFKLFFK